MAPSLKFNPFVPGDPVEEEMFAGRAAQIQDFERAFVQTRHGRPTNIMLVGERGIGKTSLLNHVEKLARVQEPLSSHGKGFLTVYEDLSGAVGPIDITKRVADELVVQLRQYESVRAAIGQVLEFLMNWEILGVAYKERSAEIDADQALDSLVDQFVELERSGAFIGTAIFVDEADKPAPEVGLGTWCKTFLERYKRRNGRKLMLGLAGQAQLRDRLAKDHPSSPRLFRWVALDVLSYEEREEAVRSGISFANTRSDIKTTIDDDAVSRLGELSEGYPYFLQQYAYSAFEADTDNKIDTADIETARPAAVKEIGDKHFERDFAARVTSDKYRRVLHFIARRGVDWVSRKEVLEGSGVDEYGIDNALKALKGAEFLRQDDTRRGYYRIPTRAFAAWLLTQVED